MWSPLVFARVPLTPSSRATTRVAIDIARFVPLATFVAETDRHLADLRASKRLPGVDRIRLPGDRRGVCRIERLRDGIPLPAALLVQLDKLAGELGVRKLRERAA